MGGDSGLVHENCQRSMGAEFTSGDRDSLFDLVGGCISECLVDESDCLAAIGGDTGFSGFELVEFFKDGHRDDDMVLFEIEQSVGVVDQNLSLIHI